jgi:hypothetical protein
MACEPHNPEHPMKRVRLYLPLGFLLFAASRAEPAETRNVVPPGSDGTLSERIGDRKSEAPYPPSPLISSLKWDDAVFKMKSRAGDNWPIAWGGDDLQITAWGDGPGFDEQPPRLSLGFARVWGDPPNIRAEDLCHSRPAANSRILLLSADELKRLRLPIIGVSPAGFPCASRRSHLAENLSERHRSERSHHKSCGEKAGGFGRIQVSG